MFDSALNQSGYGSDTGRYDYHTGNEDYNQAGDLCRLMDAGRKSQLNGNLAGALKPVPRFIHVRQSGHFYKADTDYGGQVAGRLGIKIDEIMGKVA